MTGTRELLRASEARRARTDDRDLFAGLALRLVRLETLRNRAIGNLTFDRFNGDRILVDIERAGRFARSRTDASRKLRKIIGRMQIARGFVPVSAVDQIVPVRAACSRISFSGSGRTNSRQCCTRSATG
jgi:hypothetical protein